MRRKLASLIGGLVFVGAFLSPVTAQAEVTPIDPLSDRIPPNCTDLYDVGNNEFASDYPDSNWLYFGVGIGDATFYCWVPRNNGAFEIMDLSTLGCLVPDPDNGQITEDTEPACATPNKWDLWTAKLVGMSSTGRPEYEFESEHHSSQCLYDNTQDPAIAGKCVASDPFEHFIWTAIPVPVV